MHSKPEVYNGYSSVNHSINLFLTYKVINHLVGQLTTQRFRSRYCCYMSEWFSVNFMATTMTVIVLAGSCESNVLVSHFQLGVELLLKLSSNHCNSSHQTRWQINAVPDDGKSEVDRVHAFYVGSRPESKPKSWSLSLPCLMLGIHCQDSARTRRVSVGIICHYRIASGVQCR